MKIKTTIFILPAVLALNGCASMMMGDTATMTITANACEGAGLQCTLKSSGGIWQVSPPDTVTIQKETLRGGSLAIACKHPSGFSHFDTLEPKHHKGAIAFDVIMWSIALGWIHGVSTGAYITVPDTYDVPLLCGADGSVKRIGEQPSLESAIRGSSKRGRAGG